ncbi:hypothetical protein KM043_004951 [Ampulex compressa]|nr:hypothetical protein KM043_004951 [Ampulex compressa]
MRGGKRPLSFAGLQRQREIAQGGREEEKKRGEQEGTLSASSGPRVPPANWPPRIIIPAGAIRFYRRQPPAASLQPPGRRAAAGPLATPSFKRFRRLIPPLLTSEPSFSSQTSEDPRRSAVEPPGSGPLPTDDAARPEESKRSSRTKGVTERSGDAGAEKDDNDRFPRAGALLRGGDGDADYRRGRTVIAARNYRSSGSSMTAPPVCRR